MRAVLGLALAIAVILHTGSALANHNGCRQDANGQNVYLATQACSQQCPPFSSSTSLGQTAKGCLDYRAGERFSVGVPDLPRERSDRGGEGMAIRGRRVRGREVKVQRRGLSDIRPPPISHLPPSNGHPPPSIGHPPPSKGHPPPLHNRIGIVFWDAELPMITDERRPHKLPPLQRVPPKPASILTGHQVWSHRVGPMETPFEKRRGPELASRLWEEGREEREEKKRQKKPRESRPRQVGEGEGQESSAERDISPRSASATI